MVDREGVKDDIERGVPLLWKYTCYQPKKREANWSGGMRRKEEGEVMVKVEKEEVRRKLEEVKTKRWTE